MLARTTTESTSDAGYTTAGDSPTANTSVSLLPLWGSPYRIGQAGRYLKFFDHKPIVLRNSIDVTSNGLAGPNALDLFLAMSQADMLPPTLSKEASGITEVDAPTDPAPPSRFSTVTTTSPTPSVASLST